MTATKHKGSVFRHKTFMFICLILSLAAFTLSGCESTQQDSPENEKCKGTFGIDTAFEPTTLNFNNVEYKIESIEFTKAGVVQMKIAWTPTEEGATPELSKHMTLYDAEGVECSRSYPTAACYDEELNQPKRKAGTQGEYKLQYSSNRYTMPEGGEKYSLILFDEFNNELSSFDFQVDPSTFQGVQENADA